MNVLAPVRPGGSGVQGAAPQAETLVELLFFAYRDFVGEPDRVLSRFGFGRAHHRVLHFVNRNPGLTIAGLLDILGITKQSLARVLKDLVDGGFVDQRAGAADRRQRLLFLTVRGQTLADELLGLQRARIERALEAVPPAQRPFLVQFLSDLVDAEARSRVDALVASRKIAVGGIRP